MKRFSKAKPTTGFKGFSYSSLNKTFSCRGYEFTPHKDHKIKYSAWDNKYPQLCYRGFHFCENLFHVLTYYSGFYNKNNFFSQVRIAKISAWGQIDSNGEKSAAAEGIRIEKILTLKEILNKLKHNKKQTIVCEVKWNPLMHWDNARDCHKGGVSFTGTVPYQFLRVSNSWLKQIKLKDFPANKRETKIEVTLTKSYLRCSDKKLCNTVAPKVLKIKFLKS